jgi:hypothetical protein
LCYCLIAQGVRQAVLCTAIGLLHARWIREIRLDWSRESREQSTVARDPAASCVEHLRRTGGRMRRRCVPGECGTCQLHGIGLAQMLSSLSYACIIAISQRTSTRNTPTGDCKDAGHERGGRAGRSDNREGTRAEISFRELDSRLMRLFSIALVDAPSCRFSCSILLAPSSSSIGRRLPHC